MTAPDWLPVVLLVVYILAMIALALFPIIRPLDQHDNNDQ